MVMKMFGRGMKHGSPKDRVLKVFRLLRDSKTTTVPTSFESNKAAEQYMGYNTQGYAVADQRMHEIEAQKAMIAHEMRHESWKAGGPV